jgi:hypothetical protein
MPPSNAPRATSRRETYRASGLVLWSTCAISALFKKSGLPSLPPRRKRLRASNSRLRRHPSRTFHRPSGACFPCVGLHDDLARGVVDYIAEAWEQRGDRRPRPSVAKRFMRSCIPRRNTAPTSLRKEEIAICKLLRSRTPRPSNGKRRQHDKLGPCSREIPDDDLEAVVGTSLDKGVELDALAKPLKEERCLDPCTGALHRSWQSMHVHVTSRML